MQHIRTECFSCLLDIHITGQCTTTICLTIQLTEINKISFPPVPLFTLPSPNIRVHSFFLFLSFTFLSPVQPQTVSPPSSVFPPLPPLGFCIFLSLSSLRSPAGPPACGAAVVDQTRSPAGGDIPFISSLFQMALLCISWQPEQPELFGGELQLKGYDFLCS